MNSAVHGALARPVCKTKTAAGVPLCGYLRGGAVDFVEAVGLGFFVGLETPKLIRT